MNRIVKNLLARYISVLAKFKALYQKFQNPSVLKLSHFSLSNLSFKTCPALDRHEALVFLLVFNVNIYMLHFKDTDVFDYELMT